MIYPILLVKGVFFSVFWSGSDKCNLLVSVLGKVWLDVESTVGVHWYAAELAWLSWNKKPWKSETVKIKVPNFG